jgi:hypothetical protein
VAVNLDNLLDGAGLEKGGCHALLNTKDHTFTSCNLSSISMRFG